MGGNLSLRKTAGFVQFVPITLSVLLIAGCTPKVVPPPTNPPVTPNQTQNTTPPVAPNQTQNTTPPVAPNQTQNTTPPVAPAYTINVASTTQLGQYLVDGRGMTLYYTISDKPNFSNLPDETLANWPVFYTANFTVPLSLNAADFGTYTRDNNVKQTTYKGYPLYYFRLDRVPGDATGNKQGNTWFVVTP